MQFTGCMLSGSGHRVWRLWSAWGRLLLGRDLVDRGCRRICHNKGKGATQHVPINLELVHQVQYFVDQYCLKLCDCLRFSREKRRKTRQRALPTDRSTDTEIDIRLVSAPLAYET